MRAALPWRPTLGRRRQGRGAGAARVCAARLGAAVCVGAAASVAWAGPPLELIVPAYFYPGADNGGWNELAATASRVPTTVIVNPDSGPGSAADPIYAGAIALVRAAGGRVIAYVHTSYGARPLSDVIGDVNTYLAFYQVDGFFVDEMASDGATANVLYYRSIYDYIKGLSAAYTVIDNPGTSIPQIYASLPVADRFVVFEDSARHYANYQPEAWQAGYPAGEFIHIVYNCTAAKLPAVLDYAVTHGAGGAYVTSLTMPNPYGSLPPPTYWTRETALALAD